MALVSMTGFARSEGVHGTIHWFWELKSVNGRGLDVRVRVPPGFEWLEKYVRDRVTEKLQRGSVQIGLQMQRDSVMPEVRINSEVLDSLLATATEMARKYDSAPPRIEGLMALKGVIELAEPAESEDEAEARDKALQASFDEALDGLETARGEEGGRIQAFLETQLDAIADGAARAAASPARHPDAIRERLAAQISRLGEQSDGFDPGRLHQEAVILAAKADIQEELDRIESHLSAARALLAEGGAVGRRLDFLTQEFNRETNTLCAKANDPDLNKIGLELKAIVDRFKEQVQNIE